MFVLAPFRPYLLNNPTHKPPTQSPRMGRPQTRKPRKRRVSPMVPSHAVHVTHRHDLHIKTENAHQHALRSAPAFPCVDFSRGAFDVIWYMSMLPVFGVACGLTCPSICVRAIFVHNICVCPPRRTLRSDRGVIHTNKHILEQCFAKQMNRIILFI